VRHHDGGHLAQHPKRKISAMKLLVTAEDASEDKTVNFIHSVSASNIGIARAIRFQRLLQPRRRRKQPRRNRLGCGVDCEGGGVGVAMKDDRCADPVEAALRRVR